MNDLIVVQKFKPNSKEVNQLYSHVLKEVIKPQRYLKVKAGYVKVEVINDIGRFISPSEFKWLMDYFENRLDANRLCLALAYCAGLRIHDAANIKITSFNPDFSYLAMSQCKAHISKKDGVIRSKSTPRNCPIPQWLSEDLQAYIKQIRTTIFRGQVLTIGRDGNASDRLFPFINKKNFCSFFRGIRKRHGTKNRWLCDIWQVLKGYDRIGGRLLWARPFYRIATHSFRSAYCTWAYEVSDKNLLAAKKITGHTETKHLEKYAKTFEIQQKKEEIKKRLDEVMGYRNEATNNSNSEIEIEDVVPLGRRKKDTIEYQIHLERQIVYAKQFYAHSWQKFMQYCTKHKQPLYKVIEKLILNDFLLNEEIKKDIQYKDKLQFRYNKLVYHKPIENMDRKVWKWFTKVCRRYDKRTGHVLSYLIDKCL